MFLFITSSSFLVFAGNPVEISLSKSFTYVPQDNPELGEGQRPTCHNCFTATITDGFEVKSSGSLLIE